MSSVDCCECGTDILKSFRFCPQCGFPQPTEEQKRQRALAIKQDEDEERRERKSAMRYAISTENQEDRRAREFKEKEPGL